VDFAGSERGVTVAVPENPMVQFGNFHFGDYQMQFTLDKAMLLGWVTNNYWETNFRAHQPGRVTARYVIQPYAGGFDEGRAHRFGLEAINAAPVMQQMGEVPAETLELPASGSLLQLPDAPVLPIHVKAARDGEGVIVRLLNASDEPQTAVVRSGLLRIQGAELCNLLETPERALPVEADAVSVELPARGIGTLRLQLG
jgi:alpha-mannosidase